MLIKTKAIVLSAIKYQEKSLIVKCFTFSEGLKSYFVPSAFSAKKSNQKIAYFQPLTLLEIEANHKNKGSLEHFKEIKLFKPYYSISTDIVKTTIVIFLSEILNNCIKEEESNIELFTYIETSLIWLDTHDNVLNFHLIFLLQLTKFLGFYPDMSDVEKPFFDILDGRFVSNQGLNSIGENEAFLFKKLIELKFDSEKNIFTSKERQILFKILTDYYTIHFEDFKKPKSLEILKEVFN